MPRDHRFHHQGVQDRRGVGESGRLDDYPVEPGFAPAREPPQRIAQSVGQVAANRATQATARHLDHHIIPTGRDQQMIESNFPELVDQHQRLPEFGLLDEMVQHGGLAAAEEPGQQRDGDTRIVVGIFHHSPFLMDSSEGH